MDIPDDLNSDSHILEIELPSLITDQYIPRDSEFYEYLTCYWIPVNKKLTNLGYPIFSENCFFTST